MSKSTSTQIPFDLGSAPSTSRDDLIVSAANLTAVSMIDAWPDWPGHALVLAGPVGSGKTHISTVWQGVSGAKLIFCDELSDHLEAIMAHIDDGGSVCVEDVQAGDIDETALFHLLNGVRQARSHCLLTSRSWPMEWNVELPDLKSRLLAAQVVELKEPDDELLKAVMFKIFADRQLFIDEKLVDYCVVRMERSLDTAGRLIAAIDSEALAGKSKITRTIVTRALDKLAQG